MKVMFDTNIYISFIRNRSFEHILQQRGTVKYISAIVLMELWAGTRTRKAESLLNQLQKPYKDANRIVTLSVSDYISTGNILSDLPVMYHDLYKKADFINDIQIALSAMSIGATLYTENKIHFDIIKSFLKGLKIEYPAP
jgi:predicted nucleic acid-binding protein